MHCVGLSIVPPQGFEAIFIEILQPKWYCLLVKLPLADDKMCNNALFHTKFARPRNIIVRILMVYVFSDLDPMVYVDLISLLS